MSSQILNKFLPYRDTLSLPIKFYISIYVLSIFLISRCVFLFFIKKKKNIKVSVRESDYSKRCFDFNLVKFSKKL